MLNKMSKKIEKSLDLAIFVNFSDLPKGGRGWYPTPLWLSLIIRVVLFI